MTDRPPLPQAIWDTLSSEAQAAVSALVGSFERRIADLEGRLNTNSTNSSKRTRSVRTGGCTRR
jgi:transposase